MTWVHADMVDWLICTLDFLNYIKIRDKRTMKKQSNERFFAAIIYYALPSNSFFNFQPLGGNIRGLFQAACADNVINGLGVNYRFVFQGLHKTITTFCG